MPSAQRIDVGAACSWAIKKFQEHLAVFLGLTALVVAIYVVQGLVSSAIIDAIVPEDCRNTFVGEVCDSRSFFQAIIGAVVVSIIFAIIAALVRVGITRAALKTTQGVTPSFDMVTSSENLVPFIITSIVVMVLSFVGLALCIIPGLLVIWFLWFAPLISLDDGAKVGDAMSRSFNLVKENLVPCLLLAIINSLAAFFSGILLGLLGLVLIPFSLLATVHVLRQLQRQPIAP